MRPRQLLKNCQICSQEKHLNEFTKDKSKKDGLSIYCKSCRRYKDKEYKHANRENYVSYRKRQNQKNYLQKRDYALRYRYGINAEQFDKMLAEQGGCCKLCQSSGSDSRGFVVDHCHKTQKIRGILCSYCNRALGMFRDSLENLEKAIKYLKET